tara:strand:+ start:1290 stop:1877 length:588 start_codon:yes stop_codon:yes gene_type:complete
MQKGDYVKLQMDNDEVWTAEVVHVDNETVDVYYIKKGKDNVYTYSDDCYEVHKDTLVEHVRVNDFPNVVLALKEIGLRPITDSTFVSIHEKGAVPIGEDFDVAEDDFVGIHPEMRDFIVPDEEGEAFTFAKVDNDFVKETHEAVRQFNSWNPDGEAKRVKDFIDKMDDRACAQENARTRLGEGLAYTKPPIKQKL